MRAGSFFMIFPTLRTLERLAAYATVDAVLAACAHAPAAGPLWTSCPRAGLLRGKEARYMEHEPPYGELALVCPDGQIVHALDWQHETPVPLLKNVRRLTAPNPGAMTGPGTNSYLVGDAASGYIVIDPGPDDAGAHRAAVARGRRRHPPDRLHAFACRPFARRRACCRRCARAQPPILGLPSAPTARPAARFTPDRALADGSAWRCRRRRRTHTLRVVHTPGHAANHLCLVLEEDGLLFSGDHVLNGSTTVVDPPDGDMNAYLDSLDTARRRAAPRATSTSSCPRTATCIGEARAAIAQLKAHRLKREAKIAAAMRALPEGTPEDWLPLAYDDVPERMWPVAARSLAAHVERICASIKAAAAHDATTDEGIRLAKRVAAHAPAARGAKPNC